MLHDDNIAVLAEGIWVRGRRDRTGRELVMLRAETARSTKPTSQERTQPLRVVHLADEP